MSLLGSMKKMSFLRFTNLTPDGYRVELLIDGVDSSVFCDLYIENFDVVCWSHTILAESGMLPIEPNTKKQIDALISDEMNSEKTRYLVEVFGYEPWEIQEI